LKLNFEISDFIALKTVLEPFLRFNVKKNGNLMKIDWTVSITIAILMGSLPMAVAGGGAHVRKTTSSLKKKQKIESVSKEVREDRIAKLEARLKMLNEELGMLRETLAGTLGEADERENALLRIQSSVAASLANGKKRAMSDESVKLLKSLDKVKRTGDKLVLMATEFTDFVNNALEKKVLTDLDKARIRFSIQKLKTASELFHALSSPPVDLGFAKSCRILALNDELQIAVLNVGSVNGVRNGLNLRSAKSKNKVLLRVIDVRPYVSGAIVMKGNIGDLAPGMKVRPGG
jgi:hypothetical protein